MYTKQELMKQMENMGIGTGDTVVIHISLKAVGQTEGGGEAVLSAFTEYLKEGLFLVPTHTWAFVNRDNPVYDRKMTPSCLGVLPGLALKREDGVRSLHPTHSVKAFGKRAEAYVEGEERRETPTPPEGCWGRLCEENAKILLIGVGQERNTYLHAVEEWLDVPNRLDPEAMELEIRDDGRRLAKVRVHAHKHPRYEHMSERFVKLEQPFVRAEAVSYGRFGDAAVQVCDAGRCSRELCRLWAKARECGMDLTEEFDPVPEAWLNT